jgi:hypothetical protein
MPALLPNPVRAFQSSVPVATYVPSSWSGGTPAVIISAIPDEEVSALVVLDDIPGITPLSAWIELESVASTFGSVVVATVSESVFAFGIVIALVGGDGCIEVKVDPLIVSFGDVQG